MRVSAITLLLLAACTSVRRAGADVAFSRVQILETFVRWREGERRRDAEMAQEALFFESSGDRAFHADELAALSGVFAGPIRTAREIHLVSHPEPLGPGDYLFLEPQGAGAYTGTFVTIVAVNGRPRVLYRRPAIGQRDRLVMEPREVERALLDERTAFWESLDGARLEEEVARTKRLLRYEVEAERFARARAVPLAPFSPPPADVLRTLAPLPPPEAKRWILDALETARARAERAPDGPGAG